MNNRAKALKILFIAVAVVGFFAISDRVLNEARRKAVPKRLHVVEPNVLLRSGQLRASHLEEAIRKHGIKTIVCLNAGEASYEPEIARRLNVRHVPYAMPGNGVGEPHEFAEILELLGDPHNHPVLVHCQAGAYRTGVTVALFRLAFQNWDLEDAILEMQAYGFTGEADVIEHVRRTFAGLKATSIADYRKLAAERFGHWEQLVQLPASSTKVRQ